MNNRRYAALIALALLAALPAAAAKVVNRTIATVNGEAILLSEFEKNWEAFMDQQEKMLPPDRRTPAWEKEAKGRMLQQMIDDRLLLQEAKKRKTRVGQRDFENGKVQVKSRFLPDEGRQELERIVQKAMADKPQDPGSLDPAGGVDLSAAWKELAKSKPSAVKEAESRFKEELAKEGLTEKKFEDRIRDQLSVVQLTGQEVRTRTKEPSDAEARALFDDLMRVMEGKEVKDRDAEAQADLQSMARYFGAQASEQVRARHILIRLEPNASFKDKSAAKRKLEDLRKKISGGADFAEAAREISDDKASAQAGGDLGFFGRGQMVQPFEKAAFDLKKPGDLSPVVETEFGLHLIRLEEKKPAGRLKFDEVRDQLKEYLYRAQQQETFERFVQDLRKGASIKIVMDPAAAEANKK
ncbi:MAG: peptidylprolyl isomerase [Elusimicrobiota bacterium]